MFNLVAIVNFAIQFLAPIVALTPTKVDDAILQALSAVKDSPALLELLDALLGNQKVLKAASSGSNGEFSACVMDECQAFAAANPGIEDASRGAGINWLALISGMPGIVKAVLSVIAMFKNNPPVVANAERSATAPDAPDASVSGGESASPSIA